MKITVVGAGTLGRVLGTRLANGGAHVTFVVRRPVADPIVIERADSGERQELRGFAQQQTMPAQSDALLVCLPTELLDAPTLERIAETEAAAALMLPLLPTTWTRVREKLGDRAVAALPSVTGYVREDDVARYWLPRRAHTLVDAAGGLDSLVPLLERSGIPAALEANVAATNQVTTATFLPMAMGVGAASSVERAMSDDDLVDDALTAMHEVEPMVRTWGNPPSWVPLLTKFVGPRMLRMGVGIAEHTSPEAIHYVDVHFGQSRVATARALADELIALCAERALVHEALVRLRTRLQ